MIVILVVAGLVLGTGAAVALSFAHRDAYPSQGADLLAYALKHSELVDATEGERGLTCILIRRDHQAALEEARAKRGFFEGYKPAYDQDRYLAAQKQAIVKLLASSDSAALAGLSRELTSLTDPTLSDLKTVAKRLAQEAVNLDHEKSWRSLEALAWALYRSGDAAHAAMVEDQASEVAPEGAAKAQCASQASVFKSTRSPSPGVQARCLEIGGPMLQVSAQPSGIAQRATRRIAISPACSSAGLPMQRDGEAAAHGRVRAVATLDGRRSRARR